MNQIINGFSHGMKSGIDASIFPDNSWRMMRNGHIISKDDHGFVVSNVKVPGDVFQLPEDYVPIGSCEFNNALYLVLYDGTNIQVGSYSLFDGIWAYRPLGNLLTDTGLGAFTIPASIVGYDGTKLLDVLIREGYNGGVSIYICDGLNANIVINTASQYINTTASPLTPSALRMFNTMDSMPSFEGEVINGGQLKPGSYFISVRLVTNDYNNTIFFDQQGPFVIAGSDSGYIDKDDITLPRSIKLSISDADTDYNYAEIAIMRYFGENGAISSTVDLIDRRYPINGTVVITGREPKRSLSIEELIQSNITALSCVSHVQHDGRYYGGGWTMDSEVTPQQLSEIAKRIIPMYVFKNDTVEDALADADARDYTQMNSYDEMKYKAGEAYPFGVSFIIGGKQQTDVYPICGYDSNQYSAEKVLWEIHNDQHTIKNLISGGASNLAELHILYIDENTNEPDMAVYEGGFSVSCTDVVSGKITIPIGSNRVEIDGAWGPHIPGGGRDYEPFVIFTDANNKVVDQYTTLNGTNMLSVDIPDGAMYMLVNTLSTSISYRFYNVSQTISALDYYGANKGVYRFPFAKKGDSPSWRRRLFLEMIGVTFDTTEAQAYLNQFSGLNITGIVFMQGERIINFISQGIALNMIDRLISVPSKFGIINKKTFIHEIVTLGDGETRTMFPHLSPYSFSSIGLDEGDNDKKNIFTFPVNLIRWMERDGRVHPTTDHRQITYVAPYFNKNDFDNGGFVKNGDVMHHSTRLERVYYASSDDGDPAIDTDVLIANNAMQCTRFAFISPDDINSSDAIFSGYIRSIGYMSQDDYDYSSKNKTIRKSFEKVFSQKQYLYAIGNDVMKASDTYFADDAIKSFPLNMYRVESDRYIPDSNGCISRMKGMCEIFGDYPQTNYNIDYINSNINGHGRDTLSKAGLTLNRLMFLNDQYQGSMMAPKVFNGSFSQMIYDNWSPNNGAAKTPLPVIMTNLSMSSAPYFYFQCNDAIIDEPLKGLTYAHTINEKYVYDPDADDIYDTLKGLFEPIGSTYHPIGSVRCHQSIINSVGNYYRGDIFAQRVSLRLNRITHIPQEGNDYKDNYLLGQMMDMYLECTINHNLRCPGDEDSFWPYASRMGFSREQFAFDSRSSRIEEETTLYNEGYQQLWGTSVRFGIDTNLMSPVTGKPNAVYWSNIYHSGSYEDAFRNIPVGQFINVGLESGPIRKLVSHSISLFTVHDNGIHQLYQDGNLKVGQDGESIVIGDTGVLRNKTRLLAQYGTQHPSSIVKGGKGFYGVDWKRKKIWSTSLVVSDNGTYFYNTDDLLESKSLHQAFADMGIANVSSLIDSIFDDSDMFSGITSGYDANRGLVYFNFMVPTHGIHTLVYDERRQVFMGFYDYTPNIFMMFNGRLFMYRKYINMQHGEGLNRYVQEPETGANYNLYANGDQAPFVLTFYVNGSSKGLSNIEKDFILHRLFASDNILKHNPDTDFFRKVEWETEYQGSSLDLSGIETDTNDVAKFWKTPIFEEHQWKIPIDVQSSTNDGPNGTGAFTAFEPGATMRGSWLKVTIKYSGTDRIYINNCITDFLISYT